MNKDRYVKWSIKLLNTLFTYEQETEAISYKRYWYNSYILESKILTFYGFRFSPALKFDISESRRLWSEFPTLFLASDEICEFTPIEQISCSSARAGGHRAHLIESGFRFPIRINRFQGHLKGCRICEGHVAHHSFACRLDYIISMLPVLETYAVDYDW